jgi:hypothetical protein
LSTRRTAAATAEKASENILAKDVTKLAEDIFHIHIARVRTTAIAAYTCKTIPVILGTPVLVA